MEFLNSTFCIPLSIDNTGKHSRKRMEQYKNNFAFQNVFARFVLDALKRYHFDGLPETISERVLLQSLLWYGRVCIFEKDNALLGLPCAPSGAGLNIYGDFGSAFVFSANGKLNQQVDIYLPGSDEDAFLNEVNGAKPRTNLKGVMIRENAIMYPFIRLVMQFADAVADTYRTLDVVRANVKRPFIITCEESVVPTVKKFLEERELNFESVISSGVFDPNKIALLPLDINGNSLTDATQLVEWYENKFRELCGIDSNGQMDKKGENLIQAEVNINDDYEELNIDKCIQYIQDGLDDVNKLFGTSIKVVPREKVRVQKNEEPEGAEVEK